MNYYNEFEPKAAAALKQLISDGLIPKGDVDDRSITDVRPEELKGYTQCHFFAGIGGWSLALKLALWPDDRPVWTGSCPCQPFSTAGKQKGTADERHLWPVWFNLIRECKPPIVFGEQVASAVSHGWLDGVYSDLEKEGYACASAVLPACSVNAPHKRDRLWFVADSQCVTSNKRHQSYVQRRWKGDSEQIGVGCQSGNMGNAKHDGRDGCQITGSHETPVFGCEEGQDCAGQFKGTGASGVISGSVMSDTIGKRGCSRNGQWQDANDVDASGKDGFWHDHDWIICGDGKARRIPTAESGIRLLAYGFPERVGLLRAGGNAIVPEVAARFVKAVM